MGPEYRRVSPVMEIESQLPLSLSYISGIMLRQGNWKGSGEDGEIPSTKHNIILVIVWLICVGAGTHDQLTDRTTCRAFHYVSLRRLD